MPDNNQTNTTPVNPPAAPAAPAATAPAAPVAAAPAPTPIVDANTPETPAETENPNASRELLASVAEKISEAHNILVAISSDPSVDDLAAAIGLSLYLDRLGKRATAIYSGTTPNALEFLKPEEALETDTDVLQDFVIALDKEKADHLRYKLDGDYVKIYITPYKSRISDEDLEFSYGDYNVDLVLALNVASGTDLDSALREHGRIMHDATVINITTANPGKFGEIEWSNPRSSSVSEMIADLLYSVSSKIEINAEEATAFLTGIIAATDRFSGANTTPDTLRVASELMTSGADQQLIAQNISSDEKLFSFTNTGLRVSSEDPTSLDVEHPVEGEEEEPTEEPAEEPTEEETPAEEAKPTEETPETPAEAPEAPAPSTILDSVPDVPAEPKPEKVIAPSTSFTAENGDQSKYGQMLADALSEVNAPASEPVVPAPAPSLEPAAAPMAPINTPFANPAASFAPPVASEPEINGVPEINYAPLPGDEVLPPPPTPPIDINSPLPTPETPAPVPAPATPETQDNSGAFKIPGV